MSKKKKPDAQSLLLALALAEKHESQCGDALKAAEQNYKDAQKAADLLTEQVVQHGRELLALQTSAERSEVSAKRPD